MRSVGNGPTLADLILDRKGGRSFEKLAEDCGGTPAGRRLQQLANGNRPMKNFPDPETITAMARGLGVSTTEVVLASARSLGVTVAGTDATALVIADGGTLPPAAQEALRYLGTEMVRLHAETIAKVMQFRPQLVRPSEEQLLARFGGMAAFATTGDEPPAN
jgi:hypothetical protein